MCWVFFSYIASIALLPIYSIIHGLCICTLWKLFGRLSVYYMERKKIVRPISPYLSRNMQQKSFVIGQTIILFCLNHVNCWFCYFLFYWKQFRQQNKKQIFLFACVLLSIYLCFNRDRMLIWVNKQEKKIEFYVGDRKNASSKSYKLNFL